MPDVGIVSYGRDFTKEIYEASRLRDDVRFAVYEDLDDVNVVHSLYVIYLPHVTPINLQSPQALLRAIERLLKGTHTRINGNGIIGSGRNFRAFDATTVICVPTVNSLEYYYVDAGQGTAEEFDKLNRGLHTLRFVFKFTFEHMPPLSSVVSAFIALPDLWPTVERDGRLDLKPRVSLQPDGAEDSGLQFSRALHAATVSLTQAADLIRGDNSVLGQTLKVQLIGTVDTIRSQLTAPIPNKGTVENQTETLKSLAEQIKEFEKATEATSKIGERLINLVQLIRKLFEYWIS